MKLDLEYKESFRNVPNGKKYTYPKEDRKYMYEDDSSYPKADDNYDSFYDPSSNYNLWSETKIN